MPTKEHDDFARAAARVMSGSTTLPQPLPVIMSKAVDTNKGLANTMGLGYDLGSYGFPRVILL